MMKLISKSTHSTRHLVSAPMKTVSVHKSKVGYRLIFNKGMTEYLESKEITRLHIFHDSARGVTGLLPTTTGGHIIRRHSADTPVLVINCKDSLHAIGATSPGRFAVDLDSDPAMMLVTFGSPLPRTESKPYKKKTVAVPPIPPSPRNQRQPWEDRSYIMGVPNTVNFQLA